MELKKGYVQIRDGQESYDNTLPLYFGNLCKQNVNKTVTEIYKCIKHNYKNFGINKNSDLVCLIDITNTKEDYKIVNDFKNELQNLLLNINIMYTITETTACYLKSTTIYGSNGTFVLCNMDDVFNHVNNNSEHHMNFGNNLFKFESTEYVIDNRINKPFSNILKFKEKLTGGYLKYDKRLLIITISISDVEIERRLNNFNRKQQSKYFWLGTFTTITLNILYDMFKNIHYPNNIPIILSLFILAMYYFIWRHIKNSGELYVKLD